MTSPKDFLRDKPGYIDDVRAILDYISENKDPDHVYIDDTDYDSYFTHKDVPVTPQRLYQIESRGILERVFDTQSTTAYAVPEPGELSNAVVEMEEMYKDDGKIVEMHDFPDEDELPNDLFDDVVGYDDVKWALRRAMTTNDITNILFIGPPGSAKTVFLMAINDLEDSVFMTGKPTSGPGVIDKMFEERPRFVLIDEIDDMSGDAQEVLSQYTETGILDETKVGKDRKMKTNIKTFASANHVDKIEGHITDRFLDFHFDPYTREEFIEICEHILPKKEGKTEEGGRQIAKSLWELENEADIRKAIQVARLSRGDPEKVIEVLGKYSQSGLDRLKS